MPFALEGEKQAGLPSPQPTKSFWHSEPSEFLLGHRTTTELPSTADVVIIGSGMSGVFTAQQIAEDIGTPSINVVMLEAREACWGATGRVCITFNMQNFIYYLFLPPSHSNHSFSALSNKS
jgi:monoamine oxidase